MLLPLALPQAYEANPGLVVGVAPRGTTAVEIRLDGRRFRSVAFRKAGWLRDVEHDAAIVFTRHGTIVLAIMSYRGSGVSLSASQAHGARVLAAVQRPLED